MRLIFAILILQPLICLSQSLSTVHPVEGFPGSWSVDTLLFEVDDLHTRLQLVAPSEAGEAMIFTPCNIFEEAGWDFNFRMDFNPSSSNYLKVYLATDGAPEFETGYFLVLGTTADNISLWEQCEGETRLLVAGSHGRLDSSVAEGEVRVTRQRGGFWLLESNMGSGWQTEGSVLHAMGFHPRFFGLSCHYTSTRSDKFFVGPVSISGRPFSDTIPPVVDSLAVINGTLLELFFSEPMEPASLIATDVTFFPPGPEVDRIESMESARKVKVYLNSSLSSTSDGQISLAHWNDLAGNALRDTSLFFDYLPPLINEVSVLDYRTISISFNQPISSNWLQGISFFIEGFSGAITSFSQESEASMFLHLDRPLPDATELSLIADDLIFPNGDTIPRGPYPIYYHEAARDDLVFSEIMYDPTPPALLPEVEYLELFNRSVLPVDLLDMELVIQQKISRLPHYMLFPGEYVVLYSLGDTAKVASFTNGVPLGQWSGLPNNGAQMVLRTASGKVVCAMSYSGVLQGHAFKQEGGWSAECIDPDNLSSHPDNWAYSENLKGGTPGEVNSVMGINPDEWPPSISDAWLVNDSVMALLFSEPMTGQDPEEAGSNFQSNDFPLHRVEQDSVFRCCYTFFFKAALPSRQVFSLNLSDKLTDLAGNHFVGPVTFGFGKPLEVDSFDVVINELLYDPREGGCDYVELYNRSAHIADLSKLCLSRASPDGGPEKLNPLSDRCRWFLPGWLLCFAPDTAWVRQNYRCEEPSHLRLLEALPNYTNDGGTVFLTGLNGEVVDCFTYGPENHFPLLSDTKGVALERTMSEGETNQSMTWHSASGTATYGTPTGINSQHIPQEVPSSEMLFTIEPELFTPDQDGNDDLLTISYAFQEPGQVGRMVIFDSKGQEVRELINNRSLGTSGQITWDGIDGAGQRCSPGIYIVWGRVYDLKGRVKVYKTTCVLGIQNSF